MRFKNGVKVQGLRTEIAVALIVCKWIYEEKGVELVVTSANDSKHGWGSLHFQGAAVDLRTRDMNPTQQKEVVEEIKHSLTDEFDVVLESDHIHLEFQPKAK